MTLQEYWKREEVPQIPGITYSDGKVMLLNSSKPQDQYVFEDTSLDQEETEFGDVGVEIQIHTKVKTENFGVVFCGACAMGHEGFVSYQDKTGLLQWSLYQNFANPFFNNLKIIDDVIYVFTEIDYYWEIPLFHPNKLSCISRNEWGY